MEAARRLLPGFATGSLASVVRVAPGSMRLGTSSQHFPNDAEGPPFTFTLHEPLWMDAHEVSNARFAQFVAATGFLTDAERFGWSFVHEDALTAATAATVTQTVASAPWWMPVPLASWRHPEGEISSIRWRMDHPVVHVSQRDAAAFCLWAGLLDSTSSSSGGAAASSGRSVGRLPSEDEWEFAARGGGDALQADAAFPWGNDDEPTGASASDSGQQQQQQQQQQQRFRANLWQGSSFPHGNTAEDGFPWAAPVHAFGPQNALGLFNVAGNVWEWTASPWCGQSLSSGAFPAMPLPAGVNVSSTGSSPEVSGAVERAARKAGMDWRPSARAFEAASCKPLQMPAPPPPPSDAASEEVSSSRRSSSSSSAAKRELAFFNSRVKAVLAAHDALAGEPGTVEYSKKGGSFMCARSHCYRYRLAARDKNTADSSAYNLGFRCVYDALPPWAQSS